MSTGEVRKVSIQYIQLVQDLIERCVQLYMSQKEVESTLLHQAEIEPGFTELVWQKLEAENQGFFKAYHLRLLVKDHILQFNELLERQVELIHQICPTGVAPIPLSNGSHIHPMHNNSEYHAPDLGPSLWPENMCQAIFAVPDAYANTNGASATPVQPYVQVAANRAAHTGKVDVSENMLLAPSSNAEWTQGTNGDIIKSEDGHADILESYSRSPFLGTDTSFLDHRILVEHQDIERLDTLSEGLSYEDFGSD